jgi:hypothetical protein
MTEDYCEKEQALVAALQSAALRSARSHGGITRGGIINDELLAHAASCPICSEVLLVTAFLRQEFQHDDSASLDREFQTPDAAMIWRKAQARAREQALARATLPIRVARTCAGVLAILALPWVGLGFSQRPAWLTSLGLTDLGSTNLGITHLVALNGNWLTALSRLTLLGMTATLFGIVLSSWYMLREE